MQSMKGANRKHGLEFNLCDTKPQNGLNFANVIKPIITQSKARMQKQYERHTWPIFNAALDEINGRNMALHAEKQ